jgi:hypothetical protein
MPDVSTRPEWQRNMPAPSNPASRLWWLPAAMLLGIWVWHSGGGKSLRPAVDYSIFYDWVAAGRIARVVIDGSLLECDLRTASLRGLDASPKRLAHLDRLFKPQPT